MKTRIRALTPACKRHCERHWVVPYLSLREGIFCASSAAEVMRMVTCARKPAATISRLFLLQIRRREGNNAASRFCEKHFLSERTLHGEFIRVDGDVDGSVMNADEWVR